MNLKQTLFNITNIFKIYSKIVKKEAKKVPRIFLYLNMLLEYLKTNRFHFFFFFFCIAQLFAEIFGLKFFNLTSELVVKIRNISTKKIISYGRDTTSLNMWF
jgi:hypothetical protein